MMRILAAIVFGLALVSPAIAADDITIERVVGPEIRGTYKHPASFTELAGGDLYIVYYGGEGEYKGDTAVYGLRLKKGTSKWTTPVIIADTPGRSEGNAAVWQAPDGLVWLFYVTNYGPTWSSASSTRSPPTARRRGPMRPFWPSSWGRWPAGSRSF